MDKKTIESQTNTKKASTKLQKVADKMVNNFGIQVNHLPPSMPVLLSRGKMYENDENVSTASYMLCNVKIITPQIYNNFYS